MMEERRILPERIGSYRILEELGEGGVGIVYLAQGEGSTAPCALKVLRSGIGGREMQSRFELEAKVLQQLRHPGIAAFLDAGQAEVETASGNATVPFLALEFVDGKPIHVHAAQLGMDERSRIELVARVCDAIQVAHEAGVVHRDLKPANILVLADEHDPVGHPKVLDFGIARASNVDRDMFTETGTGALLGTVPYMSPEQVSLDEARPDERSDQYSLGILLFELLTGHLPYLVKGVGLPTAARTIRREDPTRLSAAFGRDLGNIVGQALEKDPERRYASVGEFAKDLRRFLNGEPVQARAPGAVHSLRRFGRRYPIATTMLTLGTLGLVGVGGLLVDAVQAMNSAKEEAEEATSAEASALERERQLTDEREILLRLADEAELLALESLSDGYWPIHPDRVPGLEDWVRRAEALVHSLGGHSAALAKLDAGQLASFGTDVSEREWWGKSLRELVGSIERLAEPRVGALARMRSHLHAASTLRQRTIGDCVEAWEHAADAVRAHPEFGGLELAPQLGLVPLGADPDSGLQEFWHTESGARPERDDSTAALMIGEETGIVLVLLPGGVFPMGAQTINRNHVNYDEMADQAEAPVHDVELGPFFISKYELTQGQWLQVMKTSSSLYVRGSSRTKDRVDLSHPAESFTWNEARVVAERLGLMLPTEARWEYAARAGSDAPWSTGPYVEDMEFAANLSDQAAKLDGADSDQEYEPWNDGFSVHAPVGSFVPNAFGLYDVHGNVWEWCRDAMDFAFYGSSPMREPFNEESPVDPPHRIVRGGGFSVPAHQARSSERLFFNQEAMRNQAIGVRLVRPLERME